MGLVGVAMAFVVGNLGTINHVIYAIDGAIGGPLCGLFFVGIFTPWVNPKAAFIGLFLSSVVNLWIGIGQFVIGGKSPVRLPLTVDACAGEDLLTTPPFSFNTTLPATLNATLSASLSDTEALPHHTIYDLSYCYNGAIGIILNIVISSIASICTGPLLPRDIRSDLVYPPCSKLYRRLCSLLGHRLEDSKEECAEKEITLSMLPSK
ncbi:sodium-dependent multivitamin transporter-like [Penaeus indicus]|uniref:sodium-dependent multivitamin transporter-like n=1 Tax=Penaeus indicus TaxID=29960 RepID=UPI00300C4E6B